MSPKQVKEQLAALRDEVGWQSGREWITIKVPVAFTDEQIAAWLVQKLGEDWRRHVIIRLTSTSVSMPAIVERVPVNAQVGISEIVFTTAESALADAIRVRKPSHAYASNGHGRGALMLHSARGHCTNRPTGHSEPSERTQNWIEVRGKVTNAERTPALKPDGAPWVIVRKVAGRI